MSQVSDITEGTAFEAKAKSRLSRGQSYGQGLKLSKSRPTFFVLELTLRTKTVFEDSITARHCREAAHPSYMTRQPFLDCRAGAGVCARGTADCAALMGVVRELA